jgi:glycosyltransferase involved in cell wall biosynthesis
LNRVLFLIKGLGRGGAEQLLVNAARYLDTTEFQYEVAFLLPELDDLGSELEGLGMRSYCLGGNGVAWMGRLRSLVRDRDAQIVHTHSPYAAIGARLVLKPLGGPRLVHTEHGVWESYHPATRWGNLLTFPLNDHVFAVSHHVEKSIRYPRALRRLRMPPVETVYHGLDPAVPQKARRGNGVRESLGIPDNVPVIGAVGNFRVEKGHRYLLEAAVHVRRQLPEARFVLVGTGPLEGVLKRQARELRLDNSVIFTGARSDVSRVASSFDVFVLPSIHEGLSIALVEALSIGVPAVVTRTGGVVETVSDGVNAVVVPPRDARALGHAIVSVVNDPALRRRLAEAGKARAADFDIRSAVRRMEEVYRGLLK